ncbi:hypothetical protein JCGZ_14122 [Jatropha curcas]|uniref:Meiosis-specific protein ASY3-like coiled-coil domain-containing protein n=1 Tax=Jatropha curcas TaxID=180498 RepID=A0A067JWL0_JATCU|nr:meiosis-specific protein ASY3 [Jatropha curcas]KDP28351.1 hypothetical protein JCGZ_14122 [Jatropha curcas]
MESQNLQDQMSGHRSLGSNYHPSSQSRKISIGISDGKKRSGATTENEIVISNAERANSNRENSLEGKNRGKSAVDSNEAKPTKATEAVASPWISTRSFNQKVTTKQTLFIAKETSDLPATSGRRNKLSSAQNTTMMHSVQFFRNQMSVSHSSDSKQKKFDGLTYRRKGGRDVNSQRAEDFTFMTEREVPVLGKVATEDNKDEKRTETLRMKLWEILGTVSSPRSQPSHSLAPEACANNLKQEQVHQQKGDGVVKQIQNSDTIETDSENPDNTMKRPVTRSSSRRKVSTKIQPKKTKTGQSTLSKLKLQEKSIFSFEDGLHRKGDAAISGGSSMSARNKGRRKNYVIEPRKIHFTENNSADEIQKATHRSETPPPSAEKASSLSDKMGIKGCSPQSKGTSLEKKNGNGGDSHSSPKRDSHMPAGTNRADLQGDFSSPAISENEDQQGDVGNPSLKRVMEPQDEFESPTFRVNTPTLRSSPSSTPKTDQMEQTFYSPAPVKRRFTLGNIRSFRTSQTSKENCHPSDAKTELSNVAVELKDSPPRKPSLNGKKVDNVLCGSSSEDGDSTSSDEEHTERDAFSPEIAIAERSTFVLYPTKRHLNHESNSISKFDLNLPPKGSGESDWNPEPSGQIQENELARVVTLFASALENFKNKMKLATREKSSKILMSVSEDIHQLLQSIELQIQTDAGKLTSINKAKRKRLETRFQEQEEKLKSIHDKFKQDLHKHRQDCKSTVEELEMHHIELKGTVKKQKASHQKLVMKAEEVMETQLNDAHRRITAVHKTAREKMLQLRRVISDCLNETSIG